MESISKDNKKTITHRSIYSERLENPELEFIDENDSLLYGIKNLFLNQSKMPIDFQQGQDLPSVVDDLYFFQIDKKYRLLDIVPSSIELKFYLNISPDDLVLYFNPVDDDEEYILLHDDGQGNILYKSTVVGNCFYNSGVIIIYKNININGDYLFDDIINDTKLDLLFKYNVEFFEDVIELDIKKEDYNYSFNPTYDSEKPLFFNTVYLMNDKNEVIATAKLSRSQEIFGKIKLIIDNLRKI